MWNPFRRLLRELEEPPPELAEIQGMIGGPSLIVVSRSRTDLFEHVRRHFAGDRTVEAVSDRRSGFGRRRARERAAIERRQSQRRRSPTFDQDLAFKSFLVISR